MFLCVCKGIRVSEAAEAVKSGARTPQSLINRFGLEDDDCCGRCASDIVRLTNLVNSELAKVDAERVPVHYNSPGVTVTVPI